MCSAHNVPEDSSSSYASLFSREAEIDHAYHQPQNNNYLSTAVSYEGNSLKTALNSKQSLPSVCVFICFIYILF